MESVVEVAGLRQKRYFIGGRGGGVLGKIGPMKGILDERPRRGHETW